MVKWRSLCQFWLWFWTMERKCVRWHCQNYCLHGISHFYVNMCAVCFNSRDILQTIDRYHDRIWLISLSGKFGAVCRLFGWCAYALHWFQISAWFDGMRYTSWRYYMRQNRAFVHANASIGDRIINLYLSIFFRIRDVCNSKFNDRITSEHVIEFICEHRRQFEITNMVHGRRPL